MPKMTKKGFKSKKTFPLNKGLNYSASVFVPSTKRDKSVSGKEFKKRIKITKNFMNESFGGSTTVRSVGSFTDEKGGLVNEKIAIVQAHTTKKGYDRGNKKVKGFLVNKRKAWDQESIGFAFESPKKPSKSFHFI